MRLRKQATRGAGSMLGLSMLAMWIMMSVSGPAIRVATASHGPKAQIDGVTASALATVTTTADALVPPPGSLREAIVNANATPGVPDTINFSVTGTIMLVLQLPTITDALTINGPGATSLTISGNNAFRVFEIAAATTVTISDLTISNAFNFDGGGISNNGTLMIATSMLSGNSASGGGAILNRQGGSVTIINSTLSENTASGGGVLNQGGTVTITNSTLSDNSSAAGGALFNQGGTMTVTNSTLSNNSATLGGVGLGGGIFIDSGTMNITNSTVSGNSASGGGGGISISGGTVNIKNSIVANSTGGDCSVTAAGTLIALGVNFSTDGSCPGFTQVPSTGPGGLNLGPLQNNGGPTKTHALLAGSVAIDATDCTDVGGNPVNTDQRGVTRPQGSACDAGAYEASPCTLTCPANVTAVTANVADPCSVVNFSPPASGDCPGATIVCNPPSGSCFPLGATTVTCTATNGSGSTATCTFTVSVFNGRLQDDSAGCNNSVLFNTITGDYRWCCHGAIFTGRAKVSRLGNTFTLQHNAADRRVLIKLAAGNSMGTASLQSPAGTIRCVITDRNTSNDTCVCGEIEIPPKG